MRREVIDGDAVQGLTHSLKKSASQKNALQKNETLPFYYAKQFRVLITQSNESHLELSYVPPENFQIFNEVRRFTQKTVTLKALSEEAFQDQLAKRYEVNATQAMVDDWVDDVDLNVAFDCMPNFEELLDSADEAPVIRLLNAVFSKAIQKKASDIHFENFEAALEVRFRIDGILSPILTLPKSISAPVISRIKVMARLDISEKRQPQDGRIAMRIAGRLVDARVSTMAANHGERVVLRLLDRHQVRLNLEALGLFDSTLKTFKRLMKRPSGMVLITGPTGSGKTTTLYALLSDLKHETHNILTVEDPIEYDLLGIGQTQVNPKIDLSFARGFRAILRQDPDVVMIGEIRDLETANMAIQASLTGHLVLSTLHTNSAIGAVMRLRDMGIDPFLLSSSLMATVAQRLVRLLCDHCKVKDEVASKQHPEMTIYQAQGCVHCGQMGYQGRRGIYEVIEMDDLLKQMIHDEASEQQLLAHARTFSPALKAQGVHMVHSGKTSLLELSRVIGDESLPL